MNTVPMCLHLQSGVNFFGSGSPKFKKHSDVQRRKCAQHIAVFGQRASVLTEWAAG